MTVLGADVFGFAGVAAVLTITPGPDMVLVARHAGSSGRAAGIAASTGVCSGLMVHALAAAIGVSAVIASSAAAFTVMKFAGAAYLLVLGIRALGAACRPGSSFERPRPATDRPAFRDGLITNVLNPKIAVFFMSLLPLFVDSSRAVAPQIFVLAGVYVVLGMTWLSLYTVVVASIGERARRGRVAQVFDAISGIMLVGLSGRLLMAER